MESVKCCIAEKLTADPITGAEIMLLCFAALGLGIQFVYWLKGWKL
jgi:hypothetical protein